MLEDPIGIGKSWDIVPHGYIAHNGRAKNKIFLNFKIMEDASFEKYFTEANFFLEIKQQSMIVIIVERIEHLEK